MKPQTPLLYQRVIRSSLPFREVPFEMIDDIAGIVFGAVDERGLASPQNRQADRVQTRRLDDATVVAQIAFAIEHRHVKPAVVGMKSRCPDDRSYLAVPQIELQR